MESFTQLPLAPPSSSCTTASSSTSLWVFHSEAAAPAAPLVEREHMFNKLLTPSDVGKLNRLVIPKLYAEKYFPLDLSSADKGLQLCFEDRNGKKWPFRYSYWNSSQSYVMTKGWSRFVKEKKLDAGDTISFGRGVGESGQGHLFIGWHRRELPQHRPPLYSTQFSSTGKSLVPWAGVLPSPTLSMYNVANLGTHGAEQPCFYSRPMKHRPHVRVQVSGGGDRIVDAPMVLDSVPVGRGVTGPKRVRLFGVNLESFERPEGHGPNQKAVPLVQPKSPLQWSLGFAETSVTWTGNRQQRSMNLKFKFSEKFQIKEID